MKKISLICFLISGLLYTGISDIKYQLLFLLPLLYGFLWYYCHFFRNNALKYISLSILFATSFIRYVITPYIMMLGDFDSNASHYGISLFQQAIIIMAYEEVVFFFVVNYFSSRFLKDTTGARSIDIRKIRNKGIIMLICIAIVLISLFPVLLSRFHFVPTLTGEEGTDVVESNLSGGLYLIIGSVKLLFILLLLNFCCRKYNYTGSDRYISISILIIILNSLVVNDLSRFGILTPALAYIYFLTLIYPSKKKKIISLSGIFIFISVAYTTFIKMFSEARGGDDGKSGDIGNWGNTLQVYFQNGSDVVIGLSSSDKLPLNGLFAFLNDFFANVAVLSNYSILKFTSLYVYNVQYSGGVAFDKILPNVCAGYYYMGFIGAPIITAAICILGLWFDAKSRKTDDYYKKFLFVYAAINCSLPHMVYYTMTIACLINMVLVMYIILKLNKIID